MTTSIFALFVVLSLLLHGRNAYAGSQTGINVCSLESQLLIGERVQTSGCSFSTVQQVDGRPINGEQFEVSPDGETTFNSAGVYAYVCDNSTGNISVVPSQHRITLYPRCDSCVHVAVVGVAVSWPVAEACRGVQIIDRSTNLVVTIVTDTYTFSREGNFLLQCVNKSAGQAVVQAVAWNTPLQSRYTPLLYSHAAIMILVFGVLMPVGASLARRQHYVVHKVTQPLGIVIALGGLVAAVVYVQLTSGFHFKQTVHAVTGMVLMALALTAPFLLARLQWRKWHRGCGHVITCLGIANVLLGLAIWPATKTVAITVGVLYGAWVLTLMIVYIIHLAHPSQPGLSLVHKSDVESTVPVSISPLTSPPSRNGSILKPLSKSVISESKMVELRKKSVDHLDAIHQRELLNKELGISTDLNQTTPTVDTNLSILSETVPKEGSAQSPTQHLPPAHVVQQFPCVGSPLPHTPPDSFPGDISVKVGSSDDEEENEEPASLDANKLSHSSPCPLRKAHSFTAPLKPTHLELNAESHGDSLRVTRHSVKSKNQAGGTLSPIIGGGGVRSHANVGDIPLHTRRRKPALVPPIITTTPADDDELDCSLKKQQSLDDNAMRDLSPCPSVTSDQGIECKPRKKKVSVAPLEAVPIPPSPALRVPSMARSASFSNPNVFSDNALRSVMQMSHDAIVCANANGDIVFWSTGAVKMFGYTPGEAIGSSLEMVIPCQYKDKHRVGVSRRTEETMKYIRWIIDSVVSFKDEILTKKHSYAPEEQKHARLYEVHGLSKNGHEFPVEVNVTSFVIDGELFYTGVISELVPKNTQGRSRGTSVSTVGSDNHESTLKQKAMAVGAQMKIAHQLKSAEHITQSEMKTILASSLAASKIELLPNQLEEMILGIMKAGDPSGTGVVTFMNLLPLLNNHRLYISESGLIVRYGKTKTGQLATTWPKRAALNVKNFVFSNACFLVWFGIYLAANIATLVGGMVSDERTGWSRWAYGTGPVLSMNCALVLLPMMSSIIQALCNIPWITKLLPLNCKTWFHLVISGGVAFWSLLHIGFHFCSFALDRANATSVPSESNRANATSVPSESNYEAFSRSFMSHLCPAVTGLLIVIAFLSLSIGSIPTLRKQMRFIVFHLVHWTTAVIVYILLLVHGDQYWNPSFWKWLLPLILVLILELVHRHWITTRYTVSIKTAGPYDNISRVTIIETEKPQRFQFNPGQFVMLNFKHIDYFGWHRCYISSGQKEDKLTIYVPKEGNVWFTEMFNTMKACPYNRMSPQCTTSSKQDEQKNSPPVENCSGHLTLQFTGPYGPGNNSIFDYKVSTLVCGGSGPHVCKALLAKLLQYRKHNSCLCGCHPTLSKLYFVWVIPSGNDFEWFTDYLSDLCEDEHLQRYLDVRIFLTNIDSPPDELASALLQLGLKTAGESCVGRRPSQPQLNNLYSMTSYGVPDFDGLLEYVYAQHSSIWNEGEVEFGVFTVGNVYRSMLDDLNKACKVASRPGQVLFKRSDLIM